MRRIISFLLVLLMLFTVAGCGSSAGKETTGAESTSETSGEVKETSDEVEETSDIAEESSGEEDPYAEHVTLHFITRQGGDYNENNRVVQILEEKFNCDINWEVMPASDYKNSCATVLAGGDYPDMMELWMGNYSKEITALYEEGSIIGLKMPTTLDELEEVAKAFTFDDPDGNGQDDTVGLAGVTAADNR